MTKQEVQQRVLKCGKPIDLDRFEWDDSVNVFSTTEDELVIDFSDVDYVTFSTGSNCTFKTGNRCTFDTSYCCTFDTDSNCTFKTDFGCTFDTGSGCTFKTGEKCVVVRRDMYEVIELPEGKTVRLNGCDEKGYTILEDGPSLAGKAVEVKIDGRTYQAVIQ